MSLELPRLEPFNERPSTWQAFLAAFISLWNRVQIWWQKVVEAIETHELVQEGIIENLQTTQGELTIAQQELETTQTGLAQAVDDIGTAQAAINDNETGLQAANDTLADHETRIGSIEGGYVIKNQTPYWEDPTGTFVRTTFATYAGQTVSVAYVQAEVQQIDNRVKGIEERLAALITDLRANGALNAV